MWMKHELECYQMWNGCHSTDSHWYLNNANKNLKFVNSLWQHIRTVFSTLKLPFAQTDDELPDHWSCADFRENWKNLICLLSRSDSLVCRSVLHISVISWIWTNLFRTASLCYWRKGSWFKLMHCKWLSIITHISPITSIDYYPVQ